MSARASAGTPAGLPRIMAVAQMLGSIASLQLGASCAKSLFPVFGAAGVTSLRIGFAALVLTIILRPLKIRSPAAWRAALPYGATTALMNLFFYLALDRLPMGIVVGIEFIGPLLLGLWHSRGLKDLFWLALTVAGLILLLRPHTDMGNLDPIGLLEASLASVCWALYILSGKRLTAIVEPKMAAALGLVSGTVFISPLLILTLGTTAPAQMHYLPAAFLVALLSSALPYTLECLAMSKLSTRDLGVLYSLEPVAAGCTGFLLLGETLSVANILGILSIVTASAGVVMTGHSPEIPEPPP
ncbi:EamA family transporter [Acetobacter fallax]|uniref:EamA family transporter n=1 Tax=Acetobacter fallax TaxID=1737473 RepID=A0ABX0K4Q1_9PROT|nr:EamA family transporter [Acetobacter fallax]NHO31309.1 EamA family transporter [Acetobacter fallax]NHO34866.1 EamA family transporter [Acetobacter fallax]